jgi:predicted homoserine dehydrogenase-like protein
MLFVDTALAARAADRKPVQVAMFGAGYMARGITTQIVRYTPGLRLAVICNRTVDKAIGCFTAVGVSRDDIREVTSAAALDQAIRDGKYAVTNDPAVAASAALIDATIEATGHVGYGALATTLSIQHRKPMVSMNAELDATCGPILKEMAREAGIILSGADGDQPVVQMNLWRYVKGLGLKPLLCGNIKGLQDRYRTPATQAAFAKQWGQTPEMVTSFADGTKISFEQAITANATGMTIAQRGMIGHEFRGHVDQMLGMYDIDQLRALGGIVDYVVGAAPSPGVYVFAEAQDEIQKIYLNYGKLGEGPLYSFHTGWHLTSLEVHNSVARVALLKDVPIEPIGTPRVEVIAMAKRPLKAGETLDGIGGFMTYGVCETAEIQMRDRLLPMGLAEDCRLKRDIGKDEAISWSDVIAPAGHLPHQLRAKQDAHYFPALAPAAAI